MLVSLDGRIHPSRWTESPDGDRSGWSGLYERVHDEVAGDTWLVSRVTMAEMSKAGLRPYVEAAEVERPHHFARRDASTYAVALDRSRKLHFDKPDVGGDHVVVLLGHDVPESHLAELASVGVSYVVAEDAAMEVSALLDVLGQELGVRRLLLEGGGHLNGSLLAAGLVDKISLLVAPALDGGEGVTDFFNAGATGLAGKTRCA